MQPPRFQAGPRSHGLRAGRLFLDERVQIESEQGLCCVRASASQGRGHRLCHRLARRLTGGSALFLGRSGEGTNVAERHGMLVRLDVVFSSAYRAAHPGVALLGTLGPLWTAAVYAFAIVTVIFAVLERKHATMGLLDDWNPRAGAAKADPNRLSRFLRMGHRLGAGSDPVVAGTWRPAARMASRRRRGANRAHLHLADAVLADRGMRIADILYGAFALVRPKRTRGHVWLSLTINAVTVVLIALFLASRSAIEVTSLESPRKPRGQRRG